MSCGEVMNAEEKKGPNQFNNYLSTVEEMFLKFPLLKLFVQSIKQCCVIYQTTTALLDHHCYNARSVQ